MAGTATAGNASVVKCRAYKSSRGMAEGAIQVRWYVICVFAGCCCAVMAGGAVIHDACMVEHGVEKGSGIVADAAILIGRHVCRWFA